MLMKRCVIYLRGSFINNYFCLGSPRWLDLIFPLSCLASNKLKLCFVLLLLFFLPSISTAFPSSIWSGRVQFSTNTGIEYSKNFEFSIVHTTHLFNFYESLFAMELNLENRHGCLFLENLKVGSVTKDSFFVRVIDEKNQCAETWTFDLQGKYLNTFQCENGYSSRAEGLLNLESTEL